MVDVRSMLRMTWQLLMQNLQENLHIHLRMTRRGRCRASPRTPFHFWFHSVFAGWCMLLAPLQNKPPLLGPALDTVTTLRMHLQCCTGRAATAACQHCQCDAIPTNGGSRLPLCCACGEGGVIPCAFRVLGRTRSLSVFSSSDKYSIQRSSSDRSLEVGLP